MSIASKFVKGIGVVAMQLAIIYVFDSFGGFNRIISYFTSGNIVLILEFIAGFLAVCMLFGFIIEEGLQGGGGGPVEGT